MANQIRIPQAHSTGIQQRILANSFFNGAIPPGDTSDAGADPNGLYKYAPATTGGLFVWNCNEPIIITQFHADFGASEDGTLSIVNLDANGNPLSGEEIIVAQQTAVRFLALDETHFRVVLLKNQALKLVSTHTNNQAQIAQALACIERTFVR